MASRISSERPDQHSELGRILLIGPFGQVGWELLHCLRPLGEIITASRSGSAAGGEACAMLMDLASPDSIRKVIQEVKPAWIVNAAAYTAVDRAEEEAELAMAVNGTAPGVLAEEARQAGAVLVHYSTDYVFDGGKSSPYTESDLANPINTYGRTKLVGEENIISAGGAHLILRTSWVYGRRGANFLKTMLRLLRERDELKIVEDQIGAPTWSRTIAEVTAQILAGKIEGSTDRKSLKALSGIYHLTAAGSTSWYGFALAIQRQLHHNLESSCEIQPIPSSDYPTPAARPGNSILSNDKISAVFQVGTPSWDTALEICMAGPENK